MVDLLDRLLPPLLVPSVPAVRVPVRDEAGNEAIAIVSVDPPVIPAPAHEIAPGTFVHGEAAAEPIPTVVKGQPVVLLTGAQAAQLSNDWADVSGFSHIQVEVEATGTTPSAVVTIEGAAAPGGNYQTVPGDSTATRTVTANTVWYLPVGSKFIKARLASVSGTFTGSQGFTVRITPWLHGPTPMPLAAAVALSDALANPTTALVGACELFWDGTQWRRWTGAALADNLANPTVPGVGAYALFWDGTQWRRVTGAALSDALANPTVPFVGSHDLFWDGTQWRRWTGAALADTLTNPTPPAVAAYGLAWDVVTSQWKRIAAPTNGGNVSTGAVASLPVLWTGGTFQPSRSAFTLGDASDGSYFGGAQQYLFSGYTGSANTYDRARAIYSLKTAQATALATAGDLTVWTPTTGKKFRLRALYARGSNAGRYEVRDATGTVITYFYLAANVWTEVLSLEANGYLSAAANNALLIRNQTGGNSDLDAAAAGNEE